MSDDKLSPLEHIKSKSRYLRGTLTESLADPVTGAISAADTQVLKFHGTYQQDDRDVREERRQQKLEPAYQFMLRTRLPGGVCTPAQWLVLDELARRYGSQSLRLTTRQTFQLHGLLKGNIKPVIAGMHEVLLDSIAACGDVNRNVICAANPNQSELHATVYHHANALSEHLQPRTRAYHEIWLDHEKLIDSKEDEPIYGPTYLPRKFKIAIAIPPSNDVDVFAHDLGFIAVVEDGALVGFNVSVGGGMGMTYGEPNTYPRLAETIGFTAPDKLTEIAAAIVSIQRDHGNRENRKRARFKYTLEEHGMQWFKQQLQERLGYELAAPRAYHFENNGDRFGWSKGQDGRWHLTLHIEAGRIKDTPARPWLTGLREIAKIHHGEFRLTPNQNLVIAGIAPEERERLDALVVEHGLDGYRRASALRSNALSCVALPTCGLAMAEAERYLPDLLARLEAQLDRHGLLQAPILLRISGCPNGCSRPYLGEIALTGKALGRYNLYLGADFSGQRLNRLYRENIDTEEIYKTLDPLFADYAAERAADERFGDFLLRRGVLEKETS